MNGITLLVCSKWEAQEKEKAFEEKLTSLLIELGGRVLRTPEVYFQTGSLEPLLRELGEGPLVVLSWLYPRAEFWLLRKLGVEGIRVENLPSDSTDERAILPIQLRMETTQKLFERLQRMLRNEGRGTLKVVDAPTDYRWYPVIDYQRCTNCLECLEFCLFGVYGEGSGGTVEVASPERCKPGCPACSRVCPEGAIIFPLSEEAGIAGADGLSPGRFEPSVVERARRAFAEGRASLEDVLRACRCECNGQVDCGECEDESCPCKKPDDEYFDELIKRVTEE